MSAAGSTWKAHDAKGRFSPVSAARVDYGDGARRLPLMERPASSASRAHLHPASSRINSRPSSVASHANQRHSDALSMSSTRRKIEDLVLATVPTARPRRSETNAEAIKERDELRTALIDVVEETLKQHKFNTTEALDQTALVGRLKRNISLHDPDGSSGSNVRLDSTIAKLRRHPDVSRILKELLVLMNDLSFTSRLASISDHASDAGRLKSAGRTVIQASPKPNAGLTTIPDVLEAGKARHEPAENSLSRSEDKHEEGEEDPITTGEAVKGPISNADFLLRRRRKRGIVQIDEQLLVQDVIYLLQGIDGKYVHFEDAILPASNDIGDVREAAKVIQVTFSPIAQKQISMPTRQLVHQIAELGRLYKRIENFVKLQTKKEDCGLMMQSLCHFLSTELSDYYRLIAILEGEMNGSNVKESKGSAQRLTLRRIAAWTKGVTLRMRLMSTIIESCQDAHGGAILSLIHSYTFHGDPLIQRLTAEILENVSKPLFHILSLWIFEGELQDPFNEFFVSKSAEIPPLEAGADPAASRRTAEYGGAFEQDPPTASSLWQKQYHFRAEMLPSFLDEAFGKKIFSAGKSLNFIRFSCGDSEWNAPSKFLKGMQKSETSLRYADLQGLERDIDDAYASASERLLDILMGKFKLLSHLRALKDYLMLTKGDFTDLLLESIGPSLDKPASSLYRHNLTASLETTIRGSNSQYDDVDIIGRLDARILDFQEGDSGWDSFTLEYRVDEPISTILDAHALSGYQVIFNHLWKIKRVETTLTRCWERLLQAVNLLRRARPLCAVRLSSSHRRARQASKLQHTEGASHLDDNDNDLKRLYNLAHQASVQLGEQLHFVKQMQGFISLEVIEYSWNDLTQLFANRDARNHLIDLDELISSHRAYLNALIAKVMLRSSSATSSSRRQDQLTHEVQTTMDTMLAFARASEDLSRHVVDEVAHLDVRSDQSSPLTGVTSLDQIRSRLHMQQTKFQHSTQLIIAKLERHSNLVVRDLATRLNFNSFYTHAGHQQAANSSGTRNALDSSGLASTQRDAKA